MIRHLLPFMLICILSSCEKCEPDPEPETVAFEIQSPQSGEYLLINKAIDFSISIDKGEFIKVEYYFDAELIGTSIGPLFKVSWIPADIEPGSYDISVYAYTQEQVYIDTVEVNIQLGLGEQYKGGVIFSLDESGLHGLIAAKEDLKYSGREKFIWGSESQPTGSISEGNGKANTQKMIAFCSGTSAAYPFKMNVSIEGYTDWYIPAKNQLILLRNNKQYVGNFPGGSGESNYWSSTELSFEEAYAVNMVAVTETTVLKNTAYRVRPIREF